MDIFGILDPDPHENLCGSETLLSGYVSKTLVCPVDERSGIFLLFFVLVEKGGHHTFLESSIIKYL